jgi:hypothetical protein
MTPVRVADWTAAQNFQTQTEVSNAINTKVSSLGGIGLEWDGTGEKYNVVFASDAEALAATSTTKAINPVTLEYTLTQKDYATTSYVDGVVGDIETILDSIIGGE